MKYNLPKPPVLKTTIIQLNKDLDQDNDSFEILTNDYNNQDDQDLNAGKSTNSAINSPTLNYNLTPKKRRRSNPNVNEEELAKRKVETKQLHSIIEKRRRIKINREFEALKYLIPACRDTNNSNSKTTNSSNNSKIDGMYKLTILKSSVEYILYLHHLIEKQLEIIAGLNPEFEFDSTFTKIPLNVNEYRNIDKDFDFKSVAQEFEDANKQQQFNDNDSNDASIDSEEDLGSFQLPSPIVTPVIHPNKYKYSTKFELPDAALALPKKKYFKLPPKDTIINEDDEQDASKTLLSLRKSSIDNLLN